MKSHGKAGLCGVAAALVLLALPVEAEAKSRGGFGAVRTGGKMIERATRSKDDARAEPTAPLAASPFAGKATTPSEPAAAAAVTAKVEPLVAPNVGTVCLAGCYDAQGQSLRR